MRAEIAPAVSLTKTSDKLDNVTLLFKESNYASKAKWYR